MPGPLRLRDDVLAPYDYEVVPRTSTRRLLDETESNMERLNRMGRGSGNVYQILHTRGPLTAACVTAAVRALEHRHPLMRSRIVCTAEGDLAFAPSTHPVQVREVTDAAPHDAWVDWVEGDMNAGVVPSHEGSLFHVALLRPPTAPSESQVLVLSGHHSACDGLSLVRLAHELLDHVAAPRRLGPRDDPPLRPLQRTPAPTELTRRLAALTTEVSRARALDGERRRELARAALDSLETEEDALLGEVRPDEWPAGLLAVHALISEASALARRPTELVSEGDAGPAPTRASRTRTHLRSGRIDARTLGGVAAEARRRGLTLHAPIGAALAFAATERQRALAPERGGPLPIISPVNLRAHFQPPLEHEDLRMAVDVAVTPIEILAGRGFWEVARQLGSSVSRDMRRRRVVSSWFRSPRRDREAPLQGAPFPSISNLGRLRLEETYGDVEVLRTHTAMSAHNSFQIGALVGTFREQLLVTYGFEEPTISRQSAKRLSHRFEECLAEAAEGGDPTLRAG